MEFRLGTEQRACGPGDVVVIPGGSGGRRQFCSAGSATMRACVIFRK